MRLSGATTHTSLQHIAPFRVYGPSRARDLVICLNLSKEPALGSDLTVLWLMYQAHGSCNHLCRNRVQSAHICVGFPTLPSTVHTSFRCPGIVCVYILRLGTTTRQGVVLEK